jgi:hypothetical protein
MPTHGYGARHQEESVNHGMHHPDGTTQNILGRDLKRSDDSICALVDILEQEGSLTDGVAWQQIDD